MCSIIISGGLKGNRVLRPITSLDYSDIYSLIPPLYFTPTNILWCICPLGRDIAFQPSIHFWYTQICFPLPCSFSTLLFCLHFLPSLAPSDSNISLSQLLGKDVTSGQKYQMQTKHLVDCVTNHNNYKTWQSKVLHGQYINKTSRQSR